MSHVFIASLMERLTLLRTIGLYLNLDTKKTNNGAETSTLASRHKSSNKNSEAQIAWKYKQIENNLMLKWKCYENKGSLTDDKSLKIAPNGPKLHRTVCLVHAKQEVGQLYVIIHNIVKYFWEIEWIPIQSLINHPIQEFPYKVCICINRAVRPSTRT